MKFFNATYIYALLIFIGYYNYHSYYNCFGIKISSFLTTGELLLSFLPLSTIILIFLGIFALISIFVLVEPDKSDREEPNDNYNKSENTRLPYINVYSVFKNRIKETFKKRQWKSVKGIISLILDFVFLILGIVVFIFFAGFILHFLNRISSMKTFINSNVIELIIFAFIWFIILYELLKKNFKIVKAVLIILSFFLLLFSIGLIKINNIDTANEILNGNSPIHIEFEFEKESIKSSEKFVYVGKTDNYLFMKNLESGENCIFPVNKIGKIVLKETAGKTKNQ